MNILIVTGMSGAGKTRTSGILEDRGYKCIDNMPVSLIPHLWKLYTETAAETKNIALIIDVRGEDDFFLQGIPVAVGTVSQQPYEIEGLRIGPSPQKGDGAAPPLTVDAQRRGGPPGARAPCDRNICQEGISLSPRSRFSGGHPCVTSLYISPPVCESAI